MVYCTLDLRCHKNSFNSWTSERYIMKIYFKFYRMNAFLYFLGTVYVGRLLNKLKWF
jgi:hypothetical protein